HAAGAAPRPGRVAAALRRDAPLRAGAGPDARGAGGPAAGAAPPARGGADEVHAVAGGAGAPGPDHGEVPAQLPDAADARAGHGGPGVDGPGGAEPAGGAVDEVRGEAPDVPDRQPAAAPER